MPKRNEIPSMNRRGSVTIFTTLWLLVVFAVASLSVDGGYWYLTRMRAQSAADGAALAGVIALSSNPTLSDAQTVAKAVAARNGFAASTDNTTTVTVNNPTTGPYAGNTNAIAVTITQTGKTFFSKAFGLIDKAPTIAAYAVALLSGSSSPTCMLALSGQFSITSLNSVTSTNCAFGSNDTAANAVYMSGVNSVDVYGLESAGGVCIEANNTCTTNGVQCYSANNCQQIVKVTTTEPASQNQQPSPDPFVALQDTTFTLDSPQKINNYNWAAEKTSEPVVYAGTYNNILTVSGVSSASFCPGTYILKKGMTIGSLNTVAMATSGCPPTTASGVSFVVLGGTLSIGSLNSVTLKAQTTNPDYPALDGMLFYVAPSASHNAISFGNFNNASLTGGIYFPDAAFAFTSLNSTSLPDSHCHAVVAASISISNLNSFTNTTTTAGCQAIGLNLNAPVTIELVQ